MDQALRPEIDLIRQMESSDAAVHLLERYPRDGAEWFKVLRIIPHRSWKARDQLQLAEHYFALPSFASPIPYEVFAAIMSLDNFLGVMRMHAAADPSRVDLLRYHLGAVLRVYETTEENKLRVSEFLRELN